MRECRRTSGRWRTLVDDFNGPLLHLVDLLGQRFVFLALALQVCVECLGRGLRLAKLGGARGRRLLAVRSMLTPELERGRW